MQKKSTLPKIATEVILLLIGLLIVVFAWSAVQIDEFRSIPVSVFILLRSDFLSLFILVA
jgi:hypothetical protein